MKIRTDVAELLRAGVPLIQIVRTLHVATITVQRTREALGLPAPSTTRTDLPATLEEAFYQRTEDLPDGHRRWIGTRLTAGHLSFNFQGHKHRAYPTAFRIRWGREPVGNVRPGCDVEDCITPAHVEDRPMRDKNRATYAAIFGGLP
ncbi:hypothetical protein ACWGLE_01320 [Streptomyces sp. NPDC055897]